MKCRSSSSDGNDPRTPVAAGGGGSNEPAKKQRTEPPFSSSHAEASSSSSHAPPPQQQQPPPDAREVGEPPRVPDLGEDLVFEVLRRAEARTLAAAACVSRGWRQLAEDERLWEAACVREWANLGFSEQQLRAVVLSHGGFRRLHAVYIRPLQLQRRDDLVFEVLRRAEARTLAAAACVSRGWRQLAEDERLWEAACVREWANLGFSEQQLRAIVLSLGGFRRLHAVYIRPLQLQRRGAGAPRQGRRHLPVRLGQDQVQLSLSLFSIGFFQKMPNAHFPKKGKGNDSDKSGGGQCG